MSQSATLFDQALSIDAFAVATGSDWEAYQKDQATTRAVTRMAV